MPCIKRIEENSLSNWQIISDALTWLYQPIELFAKIRMKQTKGYDSVHLKLEDLEENLRIEYKNYVRKDDKLLLDRIVRFLNQNYGDFLNF